MKGGFEMSSATLRTLGGSIIVTLPKQFINNLNLYAGSKVDINLENDHLTLKPARKKYTLSELLEGMKEGDMPSDKNFESMPVVGKEIL